MKKKNRKKSQVLMHANSLLESRNKVINAFKNGNFSCEYLKKPDAPAFDFTLKGINKFIEEIKSMAEKINLSLFENFFDFHHQLIMQKSLLILKMQIETK